MVRVYPKTSSRSSMVSVTRKRPAYANASSILWKIGLLLSTVAILLLLIPYPDATSIAEYNRLGSIRAKQFFYTYSFGAFLGFVALIYRVANRLPYAIHLAYGVFIAIFVPIILVFTAATEVADNIMTN